MFYGRRPTGQVGAAQLIAARYHGFKTSTSQLLQTVNVCDETIRKRLVEFKKTKTASLTLEEFGKLDLLADITEQSNPPSFKRVKIEAKELLKLPNLEKKLSESAITIETYLKEENQIVKEEPADQSEDQADVDDEEIDEFLLTDEESMLKSIIWHNINKEWIDEQENKEKIKEMKDKNNEIKRKRKKKILISAPNATIAVLEHSKIGSKLNRDALSLLFNEPTDENTISRYTSYSYLFII